MATLIRTVALICLATPRTRAGGWLEARFSADVGAFAETVFIDNVDLPARGGDRFDAIAKAPNHVDIVVFSADWEGHGFRRWHVQEGVLDATRPLLEGEELVGFVIAEDVDEDGADDFVTYRSIGIAQQSTRAVPWRRDLTDDTEL